MWWSKITCMTKYHIPFPLGKINIWKEFKVVHFILVTIAWHVNQLHDWLSIQYCVRICTWLTKDSCQKYSRVIVVLKKKEFKFDAAIPIFTQSRYMLVVVGTKSDDLYFNVDFDYFLKLKYIIWNLNCLIST